MTYLFYLAIGVLFILGGLTLKYANLVYRESKRLYDLKKEIRGEAYSITD